MMSAQRTGRKSLRYMEACLRALPSKRCHAGIRGNVARGTPADATENPLSHCPETAAASGNKTDIELLHAHHVGR